MRWAQRIVGVLLICVVAFAAVGIIYDNVAHAGLKDDIIEKVIVEIAKRFLGNRDMSDEELSEEVDRRIEEAFGAYDIYVSDSETDRRITAHCWRVYYMSLHPGRSVAYADGLIPGEYVDDWGNIYNELAVCVRTGYVPAPWAEGAVDSE